MIHSLASVNMCNITIFFKYNYFFFSICPVYHLHTAAHFNWHFGLATVSSTHCPAHSVSRTPTHREVSSSLWTLYAVGWCYQFKRRAFDR